jgi:hypothetical protein
MVKSRCPGGGVLSLKPNRLSVKQAAALMGVSEQFLRLGLQQGKFNFGTAVKTSSRWTYYINTTLFLRYIGAEIDRLAE